MSQRPLSRGLFFSIPIMYTVSDDGLNTQSYAELGVNNTLPKGGRHLVLGVESASGALVSCQETLRRGT
jgi:hypothetical protein